MSRSGGTMVRNLTDGNVPKQLILFALPLFVSNSMQALYNIIDMIVVGQIMGGAGMSAVSIGGDLLHLLTFLAMGFSAAGQVIISQYVGAGQMEKVKKAIGTLFSFLFTASVAISIICLVLRVPVLHWLNTPAAAYDYAMDYLVTCTLGLVFIYGYNIVSAILRGMGDSTRPFVFVAIAAVLNTVLDIYFVAYCGMAVFGAALATVIGQGVSFVASLVYLYIHRDAFGFDFKPESFLIDTDALRALVALGIPMAIQSAAIHISKIFLNSWINVSGVSYSALNGIYAKINTVGSITSQSFTAAGSAMVGQNLGARKFDRVPVILKTLLICGTAIAAIMSLTIGIFSRQVFEMFTADAEVISLSGIILIPVIVNLFGGATRSIAFSIINGSGNPKLNMAIALLDGIVSRPGLGALLGFALHMGCSGFWYGDALAGFVPIIIGMSYYLSGKWRKAPSVTGE